MKSAIAIALSLLAFSPTARAAHPASPVAPTETSWPMFRGDPALSGTAPGQLPDQLGLLWSAKTGGPVKSSPALAGDQVFIGSNDHFIYAFDRKTGKTNWTFKTGGEVESSPLIVSNRLFIGSADGFLYALDTADGKVVWKYQTDGKILGAPNCAWRFDPPGQTNGGKLCILVGSYDYKLHCVNASDGKGLWTYESGNYINGSPAVMDGQAIFGGCDALVHFISIDTGQQTKAVEAGAYIAGSAAAAGGRVYVGHYENEFLCIDLAEGKKVWTYKDRNFAYFSSPAIGMDRIVFGGRDKQVHSIRKTNGQPIWKFSTRGKVDSSPVVCGGKVVVGSDDGRLYVIGLTDGKEVWSYEIGQAIISSPAIAAGTIVVGCEDGQVYAFGAKDPRSKTARIQ